MAYQDNYWSWMDEQLKVGTRALGGEACVGCGEVISATAHWKFRDRHVCSSRCNKNLIRRWKAKIKRREIPEYAPSEKSLLIAAVASTREPKILGTHSDRGFPYDYDRFPIAGDVIERHGQHTMYLAIPEDIPEDTWLRSVSNVTNYPISQMMVVGHFETGNWSVWFTKEDGSPSLFSLGGVWVGDEWVTKYPEVLVGGIPIYLHLEMFTAVDEYSEFRWEALVFTPIKTEPLWTESFRMESDRRKRISAARGSYLSRRRSMGFPEDDAGRIDPWDVYERNGWRCQICGGLIDKKLKHPDPWAVTLDHVYPVSLGGVHEDFNLQAAHWVCNNMKRDSIE